MPLLFFLAGLVLVVTGINGTTADAGQLLKRDFTGPGNFFTWFFAILFAGALGYIPTLKPISYGFLVLVFVVIILASDGNGGGSGFFEQLSRTVKQLQSGTPLTSGNAQASEGGGGLNLGDMEGFLSDFDQGFRSVTGETLWSI